jgi:hypothetical protein
MGVLWKPIWNILERQFELLLVNPVELKRVPGRKGDVADSQWIAQLLHCGLLRSSFVPPRPSGTCEISGATTDTVDARTASRRQPHSQDPRGCHVKLGTVASGILGKSGRDMLNGLVARERDVVKLADLARSSLRGKIPSCDEPSKAR